MPPEACSMEIHYTTGFSAPPSRSGVDELPRGSLHHGLNPRGDAELAARPLDVKVDGTLAQTQNFSDLCRGFSPRRPGERLELPLYEIGAHRLPLDARDAAQPGFDQRPQHLEVVWLGHVVVGTEPPGGKLRFPITKRRQKHERHALESRSERGDPLEQLEAGHAGH